VRRDIDPAYRKAKKASLPFTNLSGGVPGRKRKLVRLSNELVIVSNKAENIATDAQVVHGRHPQVQGAPRLADRRPADYTTSRDLVRRPQTQSLEFRLEGIA